MEGLHDGVSQDMAGPVVECRGEELVGRYLLVFLLGLQAVP